MGEPSEKFPVPAAPANGPGLPATIICLGSVLAVIAALETARRAGVSLPVPFLLLYSSVAMTAVVTGIHGGLVAATLASGFILYSSAIGFGPQNLTGGPLQISAGIAIAFFAGGFLGYSRDTRQRLIGSLQARETLLSQARQELAREYEKRGDELAGLTAEFSRLRNQVSSAVRHSPAGVVVIDRDRKMESVNEAAARMFGLALPVDAGQSIDDFLAAREVYLDGRKAGGTQPGPLKDAVLKGQVTDGVELKVFLPDGAVRWLQGSFAPIRNDSGDIDGATVILIDVTDKITARRKLEELSRRLLHVQESERSYIARELHDEIGQHLTGIKLYLHSAAREPGNPALLDESIERVDQLMMAVRNLALEFRPSVLDDLGLVAALRWYIARQRLPAGCEIVFENQASADTLTPEARTVAFRVVQEGITNALRHAQASTIVVGLYNTDGELCIDIADNGCGFNLASPGGMTEGGYGLIFMRERVLELNGRLDIDTRPGNGTRISACLPVQAGD